MNSWATRRKITYVTVGLFFLCVIIFVPSFLFVHRAPTCFDGEKNGNETGVDCGGVCDLLCSSEAVPPTTLWSRSFKVSSGVYSLVAYVQNPNISSETRAPYVMKLYDARNVLIGQRTGVVHIPKNSVVAIFEPNFSVGLSVPARVILEFTGALEWRKNFAAAPRLTVTQNILSGQTTQPRVDAIIKNESDEVVEQIEVVAIAYDTQGNAVAASRTFVDRLEREESASIFFTWREPFPGQSASQVEIIPRIIPKSL